MIEKTIATRTTEGDISEVMGLNNLGEGTLLPLTLGFEIAGEVAIKERLVDAAVDPYVGHGHIMSAGLSWAGCLNRLTLLDNCQAVAMTSV